MPETKFPFVYMSSKDMKLDSLEVSKRQNGESYKQAIGHLLHKGHILWAIDGRYPSPDKRYGYLCYQDNMSDFRWNALLKEELPQEIQAYALVHGIK